MSSLILKNINYSYSQQELPVLDQISFTVKQSEIAVLIGRSGSGKSTLLKLIVGILTCDNGEIILNDKNIEKTKLGSRNISIVFQDLCLFDHMTVYENLEYSMMSDNNKMIAQQEIYSALDKVDMTSMKNCYPSQLSGGQKQRVAVCRAMIKKSKLLLLDEPFANLDYATRKKTRANLLQLLKTLQVPTIVVTHDPDEALEISDKIIVLEKGKVVQYGPTEEVYYNPKTKFIGEIFGDIDILEAKVKNDKIYTIFGKKNVTDKIKCKIQNDKIFYGIRPEAVKVMKKFQYEKTCEVVGCNTQFSNKPTGVLAEVDNVKFIGSHYRLLLRIITEGACVLLKVKVHHKEFYEKEKVYVCIEDTDILYFSE